MKHSLCHEASKKGKHTVLLNCVFSLTYLLLTLQTMGGYRQQRQSENKSLWRENLSSQRASKYKKEDATRQRKKRASLSPDSLTATRRRHAVYQQKRVSSLTPDELIEQRQRHAENEWLRVYALPAKEKAILRAGKTVKQRERRAEQTEEERAQDRKKDAQRKRDKRKAEKMFQAKRHGYLKDKSNPKPLWLLCDIYMDRNKIDLLQIDPFPTYHTFNVELKGKPLNMYLPKFVPGPS